MLSPDGQGRVEASSRAPLADEKAKASRRDPGLTPGELDKAMQELHKQLFEVALDQTPSPSPEAARAGGSSSKATDGTNEPQKPPVVASFIIKPQSVYGRMVQQTLDFELPDAEPSSSQRGKNKKQKRKSAKKAEGSTGTEASGKTTTAKRTKSSPTPPAP
jgi:hypothetical protein